MVEFVGRIGPLARLLAAFEAATSASPRPAASGTALVLVTGEGGIGKTSLVRHFASLAEASGAAVAWGTCWDDEQAPAWWPWTQVLRDLVAAGLVHTDDVDVASGAAALVSSSPEPAAAGTADAGGRLRLLDALAGLLARASGPTPVVVVLDDLQWSDPSSLDLVRFLVRRPSPGRLLVVGAYRPGGRGDVAAALAELAMGSELVPLAGLSSDEVAELVRGQGGDDAAEELAAEVHARSGGHPFFARELCRMLLDDHGTGGVPPAVQDVVVRRLDALGEDARALLAVAAVAGTDLTSDLAGEVTGGDTSAVVASFGEAVAAGIGVERSGGLGFAHDLYRETVLATLPPTRRSELHRALAGVLDDRRGRGMPVPAGDLARHSAAALPGVSVADAITWAREAARAEEGRFAFAEAARHLARVRQAVDETGVAIPVSTRVTLLADEADLRLKSGDGRAAQRLLEVAWELAAGEDDADLLGTVALGLDRCGARFAMPRDRLVSVLDQARVVLEGSGTAAEAEVTAALARQLQHSVPADRPQARPLAELAVAIARRLGDPRTLASCLLAQHDVLWTPGTSRDRVRIAGEIAALSRAQGDHERRVQALLLMANAQLEGGLPSFRATLGDYLASSRALRQPGHDYLVLTREAALALLDGDIAGGDQLSAQAAELGESVGDRDAGNVRMSQRLEVARARGDTEELRTTAADAVEWWVGIPAHAHSVAAGFLAAAGDLDGASRELATVLSLPDWRSDRSYMWSVFVGQLAAAAIALGDQDLCRQLVDDLRPVQDSCAVNGALVCFMGAQAHHLGLLHLALGDRKAARDLLGRARRTHQRLGARVWEATTSAVLAELETDEVVLARQGDLWRVSWRAETAMVRHSKGLADLATLVSRPGQDVPAIMLAGPGRAEAAEHDPVVDRTALAAYRARLAELEADLDPAAVAEREHLRAELRRSTRPGGRARDWDNRDAERARKAVSARIRDAIDRIAVASPALGHHLDRSVTTGTACRYEPHPE